MLQPLTPKFESPVAGTDRFENGAGLGHPTVNRTVTFLKEEIDNYDHGSC
jgi:hypothetical protein